MEDRDANHNLDELDAVRGGLAAQAVWPLGRHVAVGAIMGGVVAAVALPGLWPIAAILACAAGALLLVRYDRRTAGFFVSGYRLGGTLWITLGLLVVAGVALHLSVVLMTDRGVAWAPLAAGAFVATTAVAASVLWERAYRRELRSRSRGR